MSKALIIVASYKMELSQYVSLGPLKYWSQLVLSDPDQPADLSPWTKETLDGVFRVLLGCFAGLLPSHSFPC